MALLREAKKRGVPISGEACPHHFTLTDAAVAGSARFWANDGKTLAGYQDELPEWPAYDTNFKMNPPLRSARDREAILEGLADGTIEILCSDHAPHCDFEKEVEFDYAPFGIIGLETELALSLMQLYHAKRLGLPELIAKYTVAPAQLLNLPKGTLSVGADADVTVFDPEAEWIFDCRKNPRANRTTARSSAGTSKARPWRPLWAAKKYGRRIPNWFRRENSASRLTALPIVLASRSNFDDESNSGPRRRLGFSRTRLWRARVRVRRSLFQHVHDRAIRKFSPTRPTKARLSR